MTSLVGPGAGLLLAALICFLLAPVVRRVALSWGALDLPDHRKLHQSPVPRFGGVAVAVAVALAALALAFAPGATLALPTASRDVAVVAMAALAVFAIGVLDDVRGLSAPIKLLVECVAALAAAAVVGRGGTWQWLSTSQPLDAGPLLMPAAALWIVTLTNAVNMLDVADGVAAGISAIASLCLGVIAALLGHATVAALLLCLAGALFGFLPHNFRRPKLFLGDSGSLLAGFLLGAGSLAGLRAGASILVLPALLALGLALAEIVITVTRRSLRALTVVRSGARRERFLLRRGPLGLFAADRRHLAHRLLDLGLSPRAAVVWLYAAGAGLGLLAIGAVNNPRLGLFSALAALAAVLYAAPRWLYEELRMFDRGALLPILETRLLRNRGTHLVLDAFAVAAAYAVTRALRLGWWPRFDFDAAAWKELAVLVPFTLLGFRLAGLYRGSYRHAGPAELARAVRAVLVGGLLGIAAVLASFGPSPPGIRWVADLYLLLTLVVGMRLSFRTLEYVYQRGQPAGRRALILGTDRPAALALRELLATPDLDIAPVAFFDPAGSNDGEYHGYPVIARGALVAERVRDMRATDLIVPGRDGYGEGLGEVRALCAELGLRVLHFSVQWTAEDGNDQPAGRGR